MKLLSLVVLVVAAARFIIPMPGLDVSLASLFKDFAHLFVGGLFGASIALTACRGWKDHYVVRFWVLSWGLAIIEVVAFLVQRS